MLVMRVYALYEKQRFVLILYFGITAAALIIVAVRVHLTPSYPFLIGITVLVVDWYW
jgi:hypothetical protein